MLDLKKNSEDIQTIVSDYCDVSNRKISDINIVSVTKTVDSDTIRDLYNLGYHRFGENRSDVFLRKKDELSDLDNIEWHYIGNLQRRKVKDVINVIDYFHALDSIELAEEIDRRALHPIKCFLEVNTSGEESKHGIRPQDVLTFIQQLRDLPNVLIVGLMTMAPFGASDSDIFNYFYALKTIRDDVYKQKISYAPCTELSMGMSNDYPLAIEAGATFVRIGTAFFKDN